MPHPLALFSGRRLHLKPTRARDGRLPRPSRVLPCPPLCGAGASRTRQEAFAASSRPFLRASAPSETNEGARRTSSPPRAFPCLLPCAGEDVFPARPASCLACSPVLARTPAPTRPASCLACSPVLARTPFPARPASCLACSPALARTSSPPAPRLALLAPLCWRGRLPCPPRVLPCLLPCVGADVFPAHPALCPRPPLHGRTPVNANKKRLRGG